MIYDDQTLTHEFSPDKDIHEIFDLFEQFLLASGFAQKSIDDAIGWRGSGGEDE
jgi:hypothetical protein